MNAEFLTIAFQRIKGRLSRRSVGDDDDCEDALQEAFCRLWSRHPKIVDVSHAEGLLTTASKNIRIDRFRKQHSHQEVSLSDINDPPWKPDDTHVDEMFSAVTKIAAVHLSARDRQILFLREKDGLEFSDLARRFDISEANVRLIVSRARKTLRDIYLNKKDLTYE